MDLHTQIRKAVITDASHIAKTHRASFIEAHKGFLSKEWFVEFSESVFQQRWQKRLSEEKSSTYVAELNKKIVGLVCFLQHPDIKIAEILFLYVDPNYFRQGVGKKLMLFAMERLCQENIRMIHLWALKSNPHSRAFYESLGAITDGTERIIDKPIKSICEIKYYLFLDELQHHQ